MVNAFKDRSTFNEDISGWDVSSVTNLSGIFWNATIFNQPLEDWNILLLVQLGICFLVQQNSITQSVIGTPLLF